MGKRQTCIAFGLLATYVSCARSPNSEFLAETATCDSCVIQTDVSWVSAASDDHLSPGIDYIEWRDTLWVLGDELESRVIKFPLAGGPSIESDRKGRGPGEFNEVRRARLDASGDTLVVFLKDRVAYLTHDFTEARSVPVVVPAIGVEAMTRGVWAVSNAAGGVPPDSRGQVLHFLRPDGTWDASFRSVDSAFTTLLWPISRAADSEAVWLLAPQDGGVVAELWSHRNQQPLRRLSMKFDWWVDDPRIRRRAGSEREEGAPSRLASGPVALWDDGEVLWVVLRHGEDADEPPDMSVYQPHAWFDGVLLAVDRNSGVVLAAHLFDPFLFGFTNKGRLVAYEEDEDGQPKLQLISLKLRR